MPLLCFAHEPYSASFRFIENKNQWDSKIKYSADIKSGTLFLEKNCFTYNLIDSKVLKNLHAKTDKNLDSLKINGHAFKVNFENSNFDVVLNGEDEFPDYYNYFLGKDPAKWASKVFAYKVVNYQNLYDGIDMKVYTHGDNLKYDLILLPHTDPSSISFNYEGIDRMSLVEGNLVLQTSLGNIVEQKPYAYQIINGKVVQVACRYVLTNNKLSFNFPSGYNKNLKLIIDPTLIFSTYSGSFADNFGYTATFDSDGFLYSGSTVFGTGYPFTLGAYQTTFRGGDGLFPGTDIGITKYDTSGTKRIYSTYIGGASDEMPHSMIANSNDELFIFGTTGSSNFPMTDNAYDNSFGGGAGVTLSGLGISFPFGSDIFIARLSNDGSTLLASTFLGGSSNDGLNLSPGILRYNYADEARGEIDIDSDDNVYLVTSTMSTDFPIVGSPFQSTFGGGSMDACVVKMDNNLSSIQWSSFLGGESADAAYSLAIDDASNIYITGGTRSLIFPITPGSLYPSYQGGRADGFITRVSSDGASILNSTYFGSAAYDQIYFVELDNFGSVYVFGQTEYSNVLNPEISPFIKNNPGFRRTNSGQFISKMNAELNTYIWSTVFGNGSGRPNISPTAFLVDLCNKIYLSGWGGSPENNDFLLGTNRPFTMLTTRGPNPVSDFFQPVTTGHDFYLFVLEDDASAVHYASFFGGNISAEHVDGGTSRFDRKGKMYQAMCAGCGGHSDMLLEPALGSTQLPSRNNSDNCNIGVFKMNFRLASIVADFDVKQGCTGEEIKFTDKSMVKPTTVYEWDFGDGSPFVSDRNPTHTYANGGTYEVRLVISDASTCNLGDTIVKKLYISDIGNLTIGATADEDTIYKGQSTTLHAFPNSGYNYLWSPSGSLSSATNPNPVAKPLVTTDYTLSISDPLIPRCSLTTAVRITVLEINCGEPDIYIPNAFTPNTDGKNEVIYVRSNNIKEMFFTIYDRWGEKVFETNDQNKGWDGTYKGMKADPGVFVYYLEVTCIDDQKFFKKGNITLIR